MFLPIWLKNGQNPSGKKSVCKGRNTKGACTTCKIKKEGKGVPQGKEFYIISKDSGKLSYSYMPIPSQIKKRGSFQYVRNCKNVVFRADKEVYANAEQKKGKSGRQENDIFDLFVQNAGKFFFVQKEMCMTKMAI